MFVCIFVREDFRSGYAKNLFTVRSQKSDYVISKTLASFVAGAGMLILFRNKKKAKENIKILGLLYLCSVVPGILLHLFF